MQRSSEWPRKKGVTPFLTRLVVLRAGGALHPSPKSGGRALQAACVVVVNDHHHFHLSVKAVSRRTRSSVAAAAYRAGADYIDKRTGRLHDYTRRQGVLDAQVIVPAGAPEWAMDAERLFNAAERAEGMRLYSQPRQRYPTVAREIEIALPRELTDEQNVQLAQDVAREVVDRHGVAAHVCVHEPHKEGDEAKHPRAHPDDDSSRGARRTRRENPGVGCTAIEEDRL